MSAAISSVMLSQLRASANTSMPDLMDVSRGGVVTETMDGFTSTPSTALDDVRCGWKKATGDELEMFGSVAEVGDWIGRCPANTDVRPEDTLTVAANGGAPARTLNVKAVLHGSNEIATRILATEG